MIHLLGPLLGLVLFTADEEKNTSLRYVKPAGAKYVLESEVTTTANGDGSTLLARTVHGPETLSLLIRFDKRGQMAKAEAEQEIKQVKKTAILAFQARRPTTLKRGGITDYLQTTPDTIVATDPEWTAVFQLVRRYDAKKGGKQQFNGFWFHPTQPYRPLTIHMERVGADKIMVAGKSLPLERYQVQGLDGDYLFWADATGKVCKVLPQKKGEAPVVLEGLEEATQSLK
jgi:hypothetical protein